MELLPEFEFKQLDVKPFINESIDDFNHRKQKIYLDCDIFLQLSNSEGNSYATLDALINGLVIISTNVGSFYKDVQEDCFIKLDWKKCYNNDYCYIIDKIKQGWESKEKLSENGKNGILRIVDFAIGKKK